MILVNIVEYDGKPLVNMGNFACDFMNSEFWRITAIITSAAVLFALVEMALVNICVAVAHSVKLFESDEPAKLDRTFTPKRSLEEYEKQKNEMTERELKRLAESSDFQRH